MIRRINYSIYEMILEDDLNNTGKYARDNMNDVHKYLTILESKHLLFSKVEIVTPTSPTPDSNIIVNQFMALEKQTGVIVYNDAAVVLDFSTKNSNKYYNVEVKAREVLQDSQTRNFIDEDGNTFTQDVYKEAAYTSEFSLNEGTVSAAPVTTVGYIKIAEVFWDGSAVVVGNIENVSSLYGEDNAAWTTEKGITQKSLTYGEHRNTFDHPDESVAIEKLTQSLQDLITSGGASEVPSDTLHGNGVITGYGDEFEIDFVDSEPALDDDQGRIKSGAVLDNGKAHLLRDGDGGEVKKFEFTPTDPVRSNSLDTRIQVGKTKDVDYEDIDLGSSNQLQRWFDTDSMDTGVADGQGAGTALGAGKVSPEAAATDMWDDTGTTQYTVTFDGVDSGADFSINTTNGQVTKQNGSIIGNVFQVKYVASLDRYDLVQIEEDDSVLIKEGTYNTSGVPQIPTADEDIRGLWIIKINGNDIALSASNLYQDIRIFVPKKSKSGIFRNVIINPDGEVAQRGASGSASFTAATTPANNDDTYLIDRWNLLSDGNDIVDVSQSDDAPEESRSSMKFVVATIDKKFGIAQFIENKNSLPLVNRNISVSFQAKTTTAKVINNIRCAVISWDSTADVVTSDIVSAWNAQGTNPTLVANWTYENVASDLALTTEWQKFTVENIKIDTASMENIALFIWCDDDNAALNDELFISQIQINEGVVSLPFQPRHFDKELTMCQRYYEKSYDLDVAPGSVDDNGSVQFRAPFTGATNNSVQFKIFKITNPTVLNWSPVTGASGQIRDYTTNGDLGSSVGLIGHGAYSETQVLTDSRQYGWHYTADAEL